MSRGAIPLVEETHVSSPRLSLTCEPDVDSAYALNDNYQLIMHCLPSMKAVKKYSHIAETVGSGYP
jgi:hypothetical protein